MIKNYLVLFVRNMLRNKTFSLINVLGLTLGIACFSIIIVFAEFEFSFDKFHRQSGNVYRIVKDFANNEGLRTPDATTPPALSAKLRTDVPEVESITRFLPNGGRRNLFYYDDKQFYELELLRIDSTFFSVFDFEFVKGSKEERGHMLKIFKYVNDVGGKAISPEVTDIPNNFNSLRAIFEQALEQEITNTQSINRIVDQCYKSKDYTTVSFLQWFLQEQIEEEFIARRALELFDVIGEEGVGIYMIDKKIPEIQYKAE